MGNIKFLRFIKTKYINISIKHKMMFLNSVIIFFVVLFIGIVVLFLYKQTITNELTSINLREIKQIGQSLDYIQKDVEELSTFICSDSVVQQTIWYTPDSSSYTQQLSDMTYVRYMLNNLLVSKDYLSFISIHSENGFNYYVASDGSNDVADFDSIKKTPIFNEAYELRGAPFWCYLPKNDVSFILDNKASKLSMFRTVLKLNNYSAKAYLNISINIANIQEIYEGALDIEGSVILFLDEDKNPLIYDYKADDHVPLDLLLKSIPKSVYTAKEGTKLYERKGEKFLITYTTLSSTTMKLLQIVPLRSLSVNSSYISIFLILAFLLALILGLYFTAHTSSLLTKPIKQLLESMSKVKSGHLEQYVEVKYNDEIGRLGNEYNEMITQIHTLVNKVYVLEIEEKIAELKALQAQINPHFLYNTLDTIYWKSIAGDNKDVQDMIHALSKVFRLTLNLGNEFSLVSQEKEFIGHYFLLQVMRYKNKLCHTIDFSAEIMSHQIPKLILQPFVENAIIHGLENDDVATTVSVSGYMDGPQLHFVIKDNGPGMAQAVLAKILDPTSVYEEQDTPITSHRGGYGIRNVIKRLSLYYDHNYTLKIQSDSKHGTQIDLILPTVPVLKIRKDE